MNNNNEFIGIGIIIAIILFILSTISIISVEKCEREYERRYTNYYDALAVDSTLLANTPKVGLKIDKTYPYELTIGDYHLVEYGRSEAAICDFETDILYGVEFYVRSAGEVSALKDFILTYGNCVKEKYNLELTMYEYDDNESAILYVTNVDLKNSIPIIKKKMENEAKAENDRVAKETKEKINRK